MVQVAGTKQVDYTLTMSDEGQPYIWDSKADRIITDGDYIGPIERYPRLKRQDILINGQQEVIQSARGIVEKLKEDYYDGNVVDSVRGEYERGCYWESLFEILGIPHEPY